jgi:hypothetical protein
LPPPIPIRRATDLNGRYSDGSLPFQSTIIGKILIDLAATAVGLVGDVYGVLRIPYTTIDGLIHTDFDEIRGGFTSALIPKYGAYAAPGWGRETAGTLGFPPFDLPADITSQQHDDAYFAARGFDPNSYERNMIIRNADIALVNQTPSFNGIFGTVYSVGMNVLFRLKLGLFDAPPGG